MAAALGPLRWTPAAFWAATPRELAAALRGLHPARAEALPRATLDAMARAHPD